MILYIAEKPSLGRAIAAVLPKPHQRGNGFIKTGDNQVVSWCIGHLLEQAEPEAYDPAYKKWSHEHLPIVPEEWKLKPKKQVASQLAVLKKLVKEADTIIHAGDPDREGQLLVDEVIRYLGVKGSKLKQTQRCLINDLNPQAVSRSITNLRKNSEFASLSESALARSRADWLYGINLTRAYTLQGRKAGYDGVLSVGRVQTPVLGLVVRRDNEIAKFTSVPFYKVWANLETQKGETFRAEWSPSEACEKFLDAQRRNLSRALAENVAGRISFKPANVSKVERKKRKLAPPLPHSLSSLQIEASRVFSLSAQQVLDLCQSLYEKHNLITYPRSDSRYLPMAHHREATAITNTINTNFSITQNPLDRSAEKNLFNAVVKTLDLTRKSKAWNDKKVDAHHAIIPTARKLTSLSADESKVYSLICRNYLCQFLTEEIFFETRAEITIEGGLFIARAKEPSKEGWKVLYPRVKSNNRTTDNSEKNAPPAEQASKHSSPSEPTLPKLREGQELQSLQAEVIDGKTTPPAHFTDASLLSAMTGIALFVKDSELKKVLRETDGLGTEATRAGIIELLFRRQFLQRVGKTIRATPAGHGLIGALPESATLPDRTARWESLLSEISQGKSNYDSLMRPLGDELYTLIRQSREEIPSSLRGLPSPVKKSGGKNNGKGAKKRSRKHTA